MAISARATSSGSSPASVPWITLSRSACSITRRSRRYASLGVSAWPLRPSRSHAVFARLMARPRSWATTCSGSLPSSVASSRAMPARPACCSATASCSASSSGSGRGRRSSRTRAGSVGPWISSVPATTTNAASRRADTCGMLEGRAKAAARVTTPRIPAHEMAIGTCHGGFGSARPTRGIIRGRYVAGNTQTNRARITAARTTAQTATSRASDSEPARALATTCFTCRPMSRKTAFSSRNCTVDQLIRSDSRDEADCSVGALCPRTMPVTTTASTPEACASSAGR